MQGIDFDEAIRLHNTWRRQFMNAFARGSYADMPLSDHQGCTFGYAMAAADDKSRALPQFQALIKAHTRFHALASEIQELSSNGMADAADLMLPELADVSHHLANLFDDLRTLQREVSR
mgnify:FL=1|jgi:hypothetical protein